MFKQNIKIYSFFKIQSIIKGIKSIKKIDNFTIMISVTQRIGQRGNKFFFWLFKDYIWIVIKLYSMKNKVILIAFIIFIIIIKEKRKIFENIISNIYSLL